MKNKYIPEVMNEFNILSSLNNSNDNLFDYCHCALILKQVKKLFNVRLNSKYKNK